MSWLTSAWRSTYRALGAPGYTQTKSEKKKAAKRRIKEAYEAANGDFESGVNGPSSAEKDLMERSVSLLRDSGPLRDIQTQAMDAAEDPAARINDVIGRGTTNVHAAFAGAPRPQSIGEATTQNLARSKALTRVAIAGDAAVKQQALKERIAMAGFGRQRAALALGQGQIGVEMGMKRKAAADERDAMLGSAYSNAAGSVIGALGNLGLNAWQNRQALKGLEDIKVTTPRMPVPAGGN